MRNNQKQRVFIAARKRGFDVHFVYALLLEWGLPPTHSQVKVQRGRGFIPKEFDGVTVKVPFSFNPGDYREITAEQANNCIAGLIAAKQYEDTHCGQCGANLNLGYCVVCQHEQLGHKLSVLDDLEFADVKLPPA